jgi:hypothetical protein
MNKIIFLPGSKYVRCMRGGGLIAELNSASNDVITIDRTCSAAGKLSLE